VPTRDGVRLSTDLYFPQGISGKLPVILIRTPYNKNSYRRDNSPTYLFAGQGYVVAVQDVRAKYESEGREYIVSAADSQDGSDTIDWMAAQFWSDGKVGTFGCSYSGENQMDTAKLRNPHLLAMIPQAGGGAYRFAGLIQGGVIELAEASNWFIRNGSKVRPTLPMDVPRDQFVLAAKHFNLGPSFRRSIFEHCGRAFLQSISSRQAAFRQQIGRASSHMDRRMRGGISSGM